MRSKVKHHCKKSAVESYMLVQFLTVCLYTGQIRAKYVQCGTCLASYAYFSVFFFSQQKNKQTDDSVCRYQYSICRFMIMTILNYA